MRRRGFAGAIQRRGRSAQKGSNLMKIHVSGSVRRASAPRLDPVAAASAGPLPDPGGPRPADPPALGRQDQPGPPLLPGEDPALRAQISDRLFEEASPKGLVEEALVRDAIDALCEVAHWSRLRATLLEAYRYDGIRAVLAPFYGANELALLIVAWRRGEAPAQEAVARHLAELDPNGALVDMHTLRQHKDEFDWLNVHLKHARNTVRIALQALQDRRLLRAQVLRSFGMIEADAIVLRPPTPYVPIPVPADDDPLSRTLPCGGQGRK